MTYTSTSNVTLTMFLNKCTVFEKMKIIWKFVMVYYQTSPKKQTTNKSKYLHFEQLEGTIKNHPVICYMSLNFLQIPSVKPHFGGIGRPFLLKRKKNLRKCSKKQNNYRPLWLRKGFKHLIVLEKNYTSVFSLGICAFDCITFTHVCAYENC